ncbi:MAG: MerR family transcriptional regulator [Panacagrimonas sp.]
MPSLTVGKVAKASGLNIETIRYYERDGLLPPPLRSAAGYRLYQSDTLDRLQFIRRAKHLGFSLREIRDLLSLQDQAGSKSQARKLAAGKLKLVNEKIRDLQGIRRALDKMVEQCSGDGSVSSGCPIIQTLSGDAES